MSKQNEFWAVIPAAGVGKRMQADRPKQYLELNGKTVLEHTVSRLGNHPRISGVVVATSPGDPYWADLIFDARAPVVRVDGGEERCHSVLNGLSYLIAQNKRDAWVLVHDAARPCLGHDDIDKLIEELAGHSVGGLLGLPVSDTLKLCDANGEVQRTVDRSGLWRAFTPQMFRVGMLYDALQSALRNNQLVTDEASAIELAGYKPKMVSGHADNIKITHPQDLQLAELYMRQQFGNGS